MDGRLHQGSSYTEHNP